MTHGEGDIKQHKLYRHRILWYVYTYNGCCGKHTFPVIGNALRSTFSYMHMDIVLDYIGTRNKCQLQKILVLHINIQLHINTPG